MKLNRSWLTALCLLGMGAFFLLPAVGIGLGNIFPFLLFLLCPLSHVLMMRRGQGCGHGNEPASPQPKPLVDVRPALPEHGGQPATTEQMNRAPSA